MAPPNPSQNPSRCVSRESGTEDADYPTDLDGADDYPTDADPDGGVLESADVRGESA